MNRDEGVLAAIPAATVRGGPINILIVDDELKNLTVLESILDDPGYRLVRAESADQALLALVADEFALIILDIRMPGMTGFELAQMIRDRKRTARVPIIFLTAYYSEDQHVLAGYDTGAVDYLHKPVNPAILRSKVAVFSELYRTQREVAAANLNLLSEVAERRRTEEQLQDLNETLEQRVTERTESLLDADRRKNEFLATLAHELRNPLAPVRNAIAIMQAKGPAIPELQWARDVIDRQTQAMVRLIDDLMDVSRINLGRFELKREHADLEKILMGAVETSRPLIDEREHALTVTLPSQAVVVDADLIRLPQVFMNLLNNAAKYTDAGGRIDLRAEVRGNDVVVSVRDTGIGIPAEKLPTLFELFSQVEGALSRSHGGLGIGLNLAKRLVEMHQGRIEARSDGAGRGSEFVVQLPIVVAPHASGDATGDGAVAKPTTRLRILVVDDNRDAAESSAMLLEMMGNQVSKAYDGEEAVASARQFQPEVVLCDIGLPKLNGYEVCRLIRAEAWAKDALLIAVTGWGQDSDRQLASDAGFDHHMVKPVDPDALLKLLAGLHAAKSEDRQLG
ncbi:MAG TPA: response regulator [Vicinamibacterales bacterium]|nr:response regulator [Vicinamibacterales bacterium]